jgi:hypothetical protein
MITMEMFKERGVSTMAATSSVATVGGKAPFKPLRTMPKVVEVAPVKKPCPVGEEIPLELRLKRQREIIHARRGELKRFLSPRETPLKPLTSTFQMAGVVRPKASSSREEMDALQLRLKRQREIIHARKGEMRRFLQPTATG